MNRRVLGGGIALMLMSSCPSDLRDGEESNWLLLEAAVRLRGEPRRSPGDWCWVSPGGEEPLGFPVEGWPWEMRRAGQGTWGGWRWEGGDGFM